MKVYIVISWVKYEGTEILSVHSNPESAIQKAKDCAKLNSYCKFKERSQEEAKEIGYVFDLHEHDLIGYAVEEYTVEQ
jgi:hypothetical protein